MYYILWTEHDGCKGWTLVSGEDAMHQEVDRIAKELKLSPDEDIIAIHDDDGELSFVE